MLPPGNRIVLPIVEQHAENAAFLWFLRDSAVDQPHYAVRHLARLDERVEANVDGLRVAGEAGWRVASEQLEQHREPGELFAAAVLALEEAEPARLAPLIDTALTVPEARRGFLGAIGWVAPARLKPTVRAWLDGDDPFGRYLGLVACSLHRADPGQRLAAWLADPSPLVRARALRLAGELGRADLRRPVTATITADEDPACRVRAAWAAGILSERAGLPLLMATAESAEPSSGRALDVAVRLAAPDEAKAWIRRLNGDPLHRRRAVQAAGILGDPAAIPWLIERMREPDLARVAGESFALITGADLAYLDLDGEAPEGLEAGPTDAPEDENVALDADEHLPWPDPAKVAAWWQAQAPRLAPGTRHLLGCPIDAAACEHAWAEGYQRQRRAAAYELTMTAAGTGLREWRAACRRGSII